jgi:CheY-like chemotaxis protein
MRDGEEFEFEIPADHGDLVTVDGYDGRIFMVIAYQLITNCLPEEEYPEVVYEVLDAVTGEFLEADGEDVEFVTDAEHAADYLAENPPEYTEPLPTVDLSDWMIGLDYTKGEAVPMAKKEPNKPTPREISAQIAEEKKILRKKRAEQIDNLLDMRIYYADMLAKTNDEAYGDRMFAVDCELKKLTEAE